MAHSVATGAIGGGYGPYSVSISSISDIIWPPKSLTIDFTPPVQPSGLWTEYRSFYRECQLGHIHNIHERKTCFLKRWTSSATLAIPRGSRTGVGLVPPTPTTAGPKPTHNQYQHCALHLGYQGS